MALYEYRCLDCGGSFELTGAWEVVNARDIKCSSCLSKNIYRVFSKPLVLYKGKGFFVTDNKKDSGGR